MTRRRIGDSARRDVANLRELKSDLRSIASTPNFSFITPNLWDAGHDSPCANGQPGGLNRWIPYCASGFRSF